MHIIFLTDNFPPESNAPASRTYEHAAQWVAEGNLVTVITCAPNFPEGRVFDGYKNVLYQKSSMDGIEVVRVKTYITANEGFLRRTLDYLSFMFAGFIAGLFQKKPDIIIATSPQFFCACAGWALSAVRRKPFVFELRDMWPASITTVGVMKESMIIRFLEKIELFLYHRADVIVSVTESFKQELVSRGVSADKVKVVFNGVDLLKYRPIQNKDDELSERYGLSNKFVVGYVGTHGMAHALEYIVSAAEILRDERDIVFFFVGGGAARKRVVELVLEKGLSNVVLVDRQPKEVMPAIWSLCDVALVPLKDAPLFKSVIPSKIFECMGMGLPTVVSIPKGEATEIVESNKTGIVVPPEDPEAIANAVNYLKTNKQYYDFLVENSVKASKNFDRSVQASVMLQCLKNV